jgi:hypothetical protein
MWAGNLHHQTVAVLSYLLLKFMDKLYLAVDWNSPLIHTVPTTLHNHVISMEKKTFVLYSRSKNWLHLGLPFSEKTIFCGTDRNFDSFSRHSACFVERETP